MKPLVYLKNHKLENQKSSTTRCIFASFKSSAIFSFLLLLLFVTSLLAISTATSSPVTSASVIYSSAGLEAYAQTEGNNTGTLSYTDPSSGITFQYPSSWDLLDVDPSLRPPDTLSATRLVPPGQNETGFIDNVIINVNAVSNTTLGQYTEEVLAQYNNVSGIVTITKSEPSTLSGNPAHSIEYLERHPNQPLKKLQVWSVVEDRVYVVTYAADESEYPQYLPEVQATIESLQINNGAQVQQQQMQSGEQESPAPPFFSDP